MTTDRKAGIALIVGSAAAVTLMAFHPTGRGHDTRNVVVHAVAVATLPPLLLGMLQLTSRLRDARDLAVSAFVLYALSVVALLIAAAASGFVATAVLARGLADPWLAYTGLVNQAFAKIAVVFGSAAIVLWSVAMIRSGFARALGVYGVVSAALVAAGVLVGHLRLDVHGFGAVVLLQSVWTVWAAVRLLRFGEPVSTGV